MAIIIIIPILQINKLEKLDNFSRFTQPMSGRKDIYPGVDSGQF